MSPTHPSTEVIGLHCHMGAGDSNPGLYVCVTISSLVQLSPPLLPLFAVSGLFVISHEAFLKKIYLKTFHKEKIKT